MLVDTSMSQRRVLGEERSASYRFLDLVLREDRDMAFVIHFDHGVEWLMDLTPSKKQLEKVLYELQVVVVRAGLAVGRSFTTPCCWPPRI